ncbi:MAG: pseudouridine synthase [Erythrobacter sp.]
MPPKTPSRMPPKRPARPAGRAPERSGEHAPKRTPAKAPPRAPARTTERAPDRPAGDRIAKLLARAGIASRREIERMIAEGRIALEGKVLETPATILTSLAGVTVDGKPVAAPEPAQLYAFHKPTGLITAERDPAGRPTIYTALRNALPKGTPRLMPIGRLDLNTEGLLLLTNDGALKRRMELPASQVPRTYRARAFGEVTQGRLDELMEGIEIDGIRYGPINANLERASGRNLWLEITITEGKNREVRRVLEHLGLKVNRLIRTAYGPFELADLPRGQAVMIPKQALTRFLAQLEPAAR